MKKIFLLLLLLCSIHLLFSQTSDDALRYANQNFYGTARSSAMGGAFSSLGGDISVSATNPAGLAIYRSSVAAITPEFYISQAGGDQISGEKIMLTLPSIGLVFASTQNNSALKNWSLGIVYNQAVNFNKNRDFAVQKDSYSLLDDITFDANHKNPNGDILSPYTSKELENYEGPLLASMAYNTYLISPLADGSYQQVLLKSDLLNRNSTLKEKGSNGELAFSAAANYEDIFYFGATLGIQNIDFESEENYTEVVENPSNQTLLHRFYYDKYVKTRGTGINLKLGVILRPLEALRLGIAIHTPTFFSMEDEYFYVMNSLFFSEPEKGVGTDFKQMFPENDEYRTYEYNYKTPWKFTFGGSYIFGKTGLISIDYDLIDYGGSKFSNSNYSNLNQYIEEQFKIAGNLKVGAEIRLNNAFSVRGGYNYFGNMYSDKSEIEEKAWQCSGGFGYRYKNIFIDTSYQYYTKEHTVYFPDNYYATEDHTAHTIKFTIGCQF